MGNCFETMLSSPRQEKATVVIFNGGEEKFMASTTVEQLASGPFGEYHLVHHDQPYTPLPPKYQLVAGETYYLMPSLVKAEKPPFLQRIEDDDTSDNWIKVVLPNDGSKELQMQKITAKEIAVLVFGSSWSCCESFKWKPDLETMPESSKSTVIIR